MLSHTDQLITKHGETSQFILQSGQKISSVFITDKIRWESVSSVQIINKYHFYKFNFHVQTLKGTKVIHDV